VLEPILRLTNLQLQSQCCSRLELFFPAEEHIAIFKTHLAIRSVVTKNTNSDVTLPTKHNKL
jgi:hypothetical protein